MSVRTVTVLSKVRHRLTQLKLSEGAGKILHTVAVPEKWCEKAERGADAARRAAARAALEQTLKKFGLSQRDDSIAITPGQLASHGSWRRKARHRVKP